MLDDIFISVIIPCYNVEKYIERCIKSVLFQNFLNFEVIVINDGSTDKTEYLLTELEREDSRIRLINKDNGGLSDARNVGVKLAKGSHITFIDSDDFVSQDYLSNLVKGILNGGEMSISQMILVNEEGNDISKKNMTSRGIRLKSREEAIELILTQEFEHSAWGKLFPKKCFTNLSFPKGKYYEDLGVVYELIGEVNKIAFIDTQDYFYVQRDESIMNQHFNIKKMDILEMGKVAERYLIKEYKELAPLIHARLFAAYSGVFLEIPVNNKKFYNQENEIWNNLKRERQKFIFHRSIKSKIRIAAIISLGGKKIYKYSGKIKR